MSHSADFTNKQPLSDERVWLIGSYSAPAALAFEGEIIGFGKLPPTMGWLDRALEADIDPVQCAGYLRRLAGLIEPAGNNGYTCLMLRFAADVLERTPTEAEAHQALDDFLRVAAEVPDQDEDAPAAVACSRVEDFLMGLIPRAVTV